MQALGIQMSPKCSPDGLRLNKVLLMKQKRDKSESYYSLFIKEGDLWKRRLGIEERHTPIKGCCWVVVTPWVGTGTRTQ